MRKASFLMIICSLFILNSYGVAEARGNHSAVKAHRMMAGKVNKASSRAARANGNRVKFI